MRCAVHRRPIMFAPNHSVVQLIRMPSPGLAIRQAATAADFESARSLFLEVRPSNHAAQALYRRFGFRNVAVRRAYYPAHGGREDAVDAGIGRVNPQSTTFMLKGAVQAKKKAGATLRPLTFGRGPDLEVGHVVGTAAAAEA